MEATLAPPRQEQRFRMSYEEFLGWADERHAEWTNGEAILFVPKPRHQDIVTFLVTLMRLFVQFYELGKLLTAPLEMKVTPTSNAREPDILFVAREHSDRLTEDRLAGPADLIVEVISKESVSRDRSDKFDEYEEAGVREYWAIDSRPGKARADFWVLDPNGKYQATPLEQGKIYRSTVLPGFWLDIEWLWDEQKPDPQRTFVRIVGPAHLIEVLSQLLPNGHANGAADHADAA